MRGSTGSMMVVAVAFAVAWFTIGSAEAGTTIGTATYSEPTTWTLADAPYTVTGDVTVVSGGSLLIEPGVNVSFDPGAHLQVGYESSCTCRTGSLIAEGTEGAPIRFSATDPATGWDGLHILGYSGSGGSATLRNVSLEDSAWDMMRVRRTHTVTLDRVMMSGVRGDGLDLYQSSPTIVDSTIRSLQGYALRLESSSPSVTGSIVDSAAPGVHVTGADSQPTLTGNTFRNQTGVVARVGLASPVEGNTYPPSAPVIELIAGNLAYTGNVRIRDEGVTYHLSQVAYVYDGGSLTIDPGVTVLGAADARIDIGLESPSSLRTGTLTIEATDAEPVRLGAIDPATGWHGVRILGYYGSGGTATLRNVTVEDALSIGIHVRRTSTITLDHVTIADAVSHGLHVYDASFPVTDCVIERPGSTSAYLVSASPSFTRCTFDGGGSGVYVTDANSEPPIRDSVFRNQTIRLARLGVATILDGNTYDAATDVVELVGGNRDYTGDLTIRNEGVHYRVSEWFRIYNGGSLTIEPGVTMLMDAAAWIEIGLETTSAYRYGTLHAVGTEAEPIVLGASNSTAGWASLRIKGYWGAGGTATLRNVTISDASGFGLDIRRTNAITLDNTTILNTGSHGIYLYDSSFTLRDCAIRNPRYASLYLAESSPTVRRCILEGGTVGVTVTNANSQPTILDTHFRNQTQLIARVGLASLLERNTYAAFSDVVELLGGNRDYTGDLAIRNQGVTYHVSEWFRIYNGGSLTIDPGVTMLMDAGTWIEIGLETTSAYRFGTLTAVGTEAEPIVLGATNSTAGWSSLRVKGYWGAGGTATLRNVTVNDAIGFGLDIRRTDSITLDNVTLTNTGSHGIYLYDSSFTLTNCVIENPRYSPIYLAESSPTVRGCTLEGGTVGVTVTNANSRPTIVDSHFRNLTGILARFGIASTFTRNTYDTASDVVELIAGDRSYSWPLTIRNEGVSYHLEGWLELRDGGSLTVEPGITLLAKSGARIDVGVEAYCACRYGTLIMEGTEAAPIRIESFDPADPWYGIRVRGYSGTGGTATLRNVTLVDTSGTMLQVRRTDHATLDRVELEGSGGNGIHVYHSSLAITDCVIRDPASHGVYLDYSGPAITRCILEGGASGVHSSTADSRPTITDTAFRNQTLRLARLGIASVLHRNTYEASTDVVELMAGDRSYSWAIAVRNESVTYHLEGWLELRDGGSFTIDPGVTILTAPATRIDVGVESYCSCRYGTLTAEGTEAEPIEIRPLNATTGWYGIRVRGYSGTGGTATLRNVTLADTSDTMLQVRRTNTVTLDRVSLEGAGGNGIHVYHGWLDATDCLIRDPAANALYLDYSGPRLTGCTFEGGSRAVFASTTDSRPTIRDSVFRNQTDVLARVGIASVLERNTYDAATDVVELIAGNRDYSWDFTIRNESVVYHLFDGFGLRDDAIVTVEPGVTILGAPGSFISTGVQSYCSCRYGTLLAEGTVAEPITFAAVDPVAPWSGLVARGYANSGGNLVLRNVTLSGTADQAILTYDTAGVILDRVAVTEPGARGILAQHAAVRVEDSTVEGATTAAIGLVGAHGSAILDSTFTGNAAGLTFADTDTSVVRGNTFLLNDVGVTLDAASTGNTVYDNAFRNVENARDDSTGNTWHVAPVGGTNVCLGPTIAGNCWSDYVGTDLDADGIGDTDIPHGLGGTAGASDGAPLMVNLRADFVFDTVDATLGLIRFNDTSETPLFDIVNRTWSFGDGTGAAYGASPLHDFDVEGVFPVVLTVRDSAGNTANVTLSVLLDTLPPETHGVIEGIPGNAGWWRSAVNVSLAADDDASNVDRILYRIRGQGDFITYNGSFPVSAEGTTYVDYYAVDVAGNTEPERQLNVSIDRGDPLTAVDLGGDRHASGWFVSPVAVVLSAADATSGVERIFIRVDGGNPDVYTGPVEVTGTGDHLVEAFAQDMAGNLEPVTATPIRIDLATPVSSVRITAGTPGSNGWFTSGVTFAVDGVDEGAGVALLESGVDGAALQPFTEPVTVDADGVHTIAHRATDLVDHVESVQETVVKVDATAPLVDAQIAGSLHPSGWYDAAPTVTVTASDATSGIPASGIQYRLDGVLRSYGYPVVVAATGTHSFVPVATDEAGNGATGDALPFRVDTTAPYTAAGVVAGDHHPSGGAWYRSPVTVRLTPSDGAGIGVASTSFAVNGADAAVWNGSDFVLAEERWHIVQMASVDGVGHAEALRTFGVGVDPTPPSTEALVEGVRNAETGVYHDVTTVRFLASDATSGILLTEYWVNGAGPFRDLERTLSTAGWFNFTYRSIDVARNAETVQALTLRLDLDVTAPVTVPSFGGAKGVAPWYGSVVTVDLVATDLEAGVDVVEYQLDGGDWVPFVEPFIVREEGLHTIRYHALDLAGNLEEVRTSVFGVDLGDPVTSVVVDGAPGRNGWYTDAVRVSFAAEDAVSPVTHRFYRVDGGGWRSMSTPLTLATSGDHVVEWFARDAALREDGGSVTLSLDVDAPVTEPVIVAGEHLGSEAWWSTNVTVALDASDPTSGVVEVWYRVDGGVFVPYVGPFNVTTEGEHVIESYAVDAAGNPGVIVASHVAIDLSSPVLDLRLDESLFLMVDGMIVVENELCIEISAFDLVSGLDEIVVRVTGVVQDVIVIKLEVALHCFDVGGGAGGAGGLDGGACDRAGHCDLFEIPFIVDNAPPVIDLVRPTSGSVMVGNVSAPVQRALFAEDRALFDVDAEGLPEEVPRDVTVRTRNDSLARTMVVAGPRVPLWIRATDETGVARVDVLVDGVVVAEVAQPVNRSLVVLGVPVNDSRADAERFGLNVSRVNLTVYEVMIDGFALGEGDHVLEVRARDKLGKESFETTTLRVVNGAVASSAAEAVAGAAEGLEVPPELAPMRDGFAEVLRYFAPVIDRYAREDYVFIREGVLEFHDALRLSEVPAVAAADERGRI